jgi:N,N'-diacetyllegionaminate synthase
MITASHCAVIAEIGLNHNGELDLARRSIIAAAEAGADAVKFQNFRTEDFLADRTLTFTYLSQGKTITEPFFDLCKRNEFQREWLPELTGLCHELGVELLSTPTSEDGVRDLVECGCRYIKNGSDYLTHTPLLRTMAETGLTVLVSTGMADTDDIDSAMEAVAPAMPDRVVLLHCTSSYPTAPEHTNLRRMLTLRDRYGVQVGFSDHTEGWQAAVQAVSLGAVMVEKHFTLDRDLPGPDHWFSSTPDELAIMVREIRAAEMRLGDPALLPAGSEMATKGEWRIGVVAAHALAPGHVLSRDNVAFRKPARGILPRDLDRWLGRTIGTAVEANEPLCAGHFLQ